jgi:phospholipid/cholesterol/gamma-HCH transport system substrate-binding protein
MKNRKLVVGLFVVAGLVLFTVGLFLIGNRHQAFARHIEFYAEFRNLSGLANGAKVQVAGMDAGQVIEIGVPDSPSAKFRVKLRVDERFHGLVRTDSLATIGTEGVVGGTFLQVHAGSPNAKPAEGRATLPSKEPTELADLLDEGRGTLADVDATVKNANGLLTTVGRKVDSTLDQAKTTISNANDVVTSLKEGRGSVGMLLRDESLANQVRQTVSNAQQASIDLSHASSQVNVLVSDVQSRNFPQKIDGTLASVHDSASNIDASAIQLRQTVAEFAGPDEQGVTAGVNLRQSLSNANAATSNMADDTEALKHNFFFRGFFRRRGYYNLTHIPPDKYRKNVLVTNPDNYRTWLSAEQLFQQDSSGQEQISTRGKDLLTDALARYGDSIVESPIVVEGYWGGSSPADQILLSRNRATLVRHYLQNHFQLDPGHLGAVALKNHPPDGLDRLNWDGICIVLLRRNP